jgi:hypothetical protein
LYDPKLVDELEELFYSSHHEEEKSLEMRTALPFFKDPKVKISLWTIIKDSIGKDLSKISVPVYFNSPLCILQSLACPTE